MILDDVHRGIHNGVGAFDMLAGLPVELHLATVVLHLQVGAFADPQLRTRRELVNKTEAIQGGNNVMSFEYRLVIENYKDAAVAEQPGVACADLP